jgi:hypothetical protein
VPHSRPWPARSARTAACSQHAARAAIAAGFCEKFKRWLAFTPAEDRGFESRRRPEKKAEGASLFLKYDADAQKLFPLVKGRGE